MSRRDSKNSTCDWKKIVHIVCVVLLVLLAVFQIFQIISHYQTYPLTTSQHINTRTTRDQPAVMICPESPMNQSSAALTANQQAVLLAMAFPNRNIQAIDSLSDAEQTTAESELSAMAGSGKEFETLKARIGIESGVTTTNNALKELYDSVGYTCSSFVKRCTFTHVTGIQQEIDCCASTKTVASWYGQCLLLDAASVVNTQMHELVIDVAVADAGSVFGETLGYRAFLVKTAAYQPKGAIPLRDGVDHFVQFNALTTERLEAPYGSCSYTYVDVTGGWYGADCMPFYVEGISSDNICNLQMSLDFYEKVKNNELQQTNVVPCSETVYQPRVTTALLDEPDAGDAGRFRIRLDYSSAIQTWYTEGVEMTLASLFAQIGSTIAIYVVLYLLVKWSVTWLWRTCHRKNAQDD